MSIEGNILGKKGHVSGGNYLLSTDGSGTGPVGNPAPGAIGVVLRNPRGALIETISRSIGRATNTVAEYTALVEGLKLARERGITRIRVFVDSELLVDQLDGRTDVKAEQIKELHHAARRLLAEFDNYRLSWVPRDWNKEADALATAGLLAPEDDASGEQIPPSARDDRENAQVVDVEGQAAWISEHIDLPQAVIEQVLDLEFEYMVGVGIVDYPDYPFRYYSPEDLEGASKVVDTQRLAQDAERILNVPVDVAAQIFDAEYQFLRMRGIAE